MEEIKKVRRHNWNKKRIFDFIPRSLIEKIEKFNGGIR